FEALSPFGLLERVFEALSPFGLLERVFEALSPFGLLERDSPPFEEPIGVRFSPYSPQISPRADM
ncbi:hypothetical protein, partial [uncultured Brevundimonas sp.]|uniref:hypothetical protein n=1 Tax=uncultured Brevundimonas sp. TaxID=213418 RepID=UPI00262048C3